MPYKNKQKRVEYAKEYRNSPEAKKNAKEYAQRPEVKLKIKGWNKKAYTKHKDKRLIKATEYRENNRETIRIKSKEYQRKNKDKKSAYDKKYIKTERGKEIMKNKDRKRRINKNNIIETFTMKEWNKKLDETNGICPECNKFIGKLKLTLDHIYPVSIASKDYKETGIKREYKIKDVQPLCNSCNSSKGVQIK